MSLYSLSLLFICSLIFLKIYGIIYSENEKVQIRKDNIMLNWWFREPSISNINATTQNEEKQDVEEVKEEIPEYIWVDGYKGTSKDMQGYNNFQYELGKEYTCEGAPQICENGFHFSLTLDDVFDYVQLWETQNRFFKVKALVRKSDYERYGKFDISGFSVSRINKLVAKSIILQSEITSSELYQLAIQDNSYLRLLSEEEFESIRAASSFKDGMLNVGVKRLDGKYSSTFIIALFLESNNDISNFIKTVNKAEALYNEGVSPDMRAYLLMKG